MPHGSLWDIFCTVIDNHGDLGVCWRLSRQLRDAGHRVRLWVDDASALAWMAPGAAQGLEAHITVLPWTLASQSQELAKLAPSDVWVEAFGCHLPEAFVAQAVASRTQPPAWINLEYLSAENWVARMHGLPSPVMSGPAKGWTKHFFYPGFSLETGGLLREPALARLQPDFDRQAWRTRHAPDLSPSGRLFSLFCYEPEALDPLRHQLQGSADHLLVTPGRPLAAWRQLLGQAKQSGLNWSALPYTDQDGFDRMLWSCDLNFVRGEDSLVRALWAGKPLVWHIYPQDDLAHHAKLQAFLDFMQAPASMQRFHRVWNGVETGELPALDAHSLQDWGECVQAARLALGQQADLVTRLTAFVGLARCG